MGAVCQSPLGPLRINMAAHRQWTGLCRTLLSRRRTPSPVRALCSLPPLPGAWSSQLSRLPHQELYRLSVTDPDRFWGSAAADRLRWIEPFQRVRDCELSSGKIGWFLGGKLNVSGKLFNNQSLIDPHETLSV